MKHADRLSAMGPCFNLYWRGLRFGLLLQFAIGPMCLMVFGAARECGLAAALTLVSAIALVDAFYIFLAGVGVSRLFERERLRRVLKFVSAAVLVVFGVNMELSAFGRGFIPGLSVSASRSGLFVQGLILTLSNPLTIVFWGGVLTAEMADKNYGRRDFLVFSFGLVSATLFFLSGVALLGTVLSEFIPAGAAKALNVVIGSAIAFFGLQGLLK